MSGPCVLNGGRVYRDKSLLEASLLSCLLFVIRLTVFLSRTWLSDHSQPTSSLYPHI